MRKLIAIIHYEYKMQFHRPATWGILLGVTIYALLDTYPSARNLARLEFLNEPAYFVYRTMGLNVTFFALFSMVFSSVFRYEFPLWELLLIYCPPAFFLSSLCALFGIHCTGEHVAASACGILWLLLLLARRLSAIPGAEYIYPFIRYAGVQNSVWLWNKGIVAALGLSLWGILYLRCRRTGSKKS